MTPTPYGPPFPPQRPPPRMLTRDELDRALALAVGNAVTMERYRVESQGAGQAVLVKGGHTSHLLHLVLTVITAGVWGIVWLIVALANRRKTMILRVDPYGHVAKHYA